MIRLVVALLGLAVIFAAFAGIAHSTGALEARTAVPPTFLIGPGEAQQVRLQPTVPDTAISVEARVVGGPIDLYVMPKEWADRLAQDGSFNLTQPFSFDAALSRTHVNGTYVFALTSDGRTEHLVVLDNSAEFYAGTARPDPASPTNGTVEVTLTIHYLEEEERSLLLGYVAATPGVLLVVLTVGHRIWRGVRRPPAG